MHIVHGELRKAPFVKVLQDSTMFAVELPELIKDYKTGEKTYTNYKAILFAKTDAHINHLSQTLVEGNFIVLTSEKLKIDVSSCGQYTKLFMDNARLEGSGYIKGAPAKQAAPQALQQAQQQMAQPMQRQPQSMQRAPTMAQDQQQPQPMAPQGQPVPAQGFDSFDDDIPF